ncbi:MAG TPA: diacylglycerol kinase family protein [Noviherbaspirillum sp.]|jgi:diacylglycerol kinase family enzyme|uniref:diacylglycerol/lipid kinase family protein n=1 Tax=Noviherbaspirillum sp. TaxID=1926288 RepID=UPI002F93079A
MTEPLAQPTEAQVRVRDITVILNVGAGSESKRLLHEQIEQALADGGGPYRIIDVAPGEDIAKTGEAAVLAAKRVGGMVAAAGGDGTIGTIAALCCEHGVPLGIIPAGTFNYFARELRIPGEGPEAARLLVRGTPRPVSVGYVNQHMFLINASFGLYSKVIRAREQDKSRFGRSRIVAVLSAVVALMRGQQRFAVKITANGVEQVRRTAMVFVGNSSLQLEKLDLEIARCVQEDRLAVLVLRPVTRLGMLRLLVRTALKALDGDELLEAFCADQFEMETRRPYVDVVADGEIVRCRTPLQFRVARAALQVIVPAEEE